MIPNLTESEIRARFAKMDEDAKRTVRSSKEIADLEKAGKLGRKIEVIEDDQPDCEIIREELMKRGYYGNYTVISDGTIDRIIPLDKNGKREG